VAGLEAIPVKPPFLPFQRLAQFFVFFWNFFPGLPAGGLFFTSDSFKTESFFYTYNPILKQ
jgi:hypothetical protein